MKDFTEPSEILSYLTEVNLEACDAIASNNFNSFHNVIDELRTAQINRTPLGQSVIAYNNMFNTATPFFTLDKHYAYEKLKDNDFLLTDENFRKRVHRIEAIKESNLCYLIEAKSFNFTTESIKETVSESNTHANYDITFGKIDANSKRIKKDAHDEYIMTRKIAKKEMDYIQQIKDTFTDNPDGLPLSEGIIQQTKYEEMAHDYIAPITKLASARYQFIFNYQTDIDYLFIDEEPLPLDKTLEVIHNYIKEGNINYNNPLFTIAGTSFETGSYKDRYTLPQYLTSTASYPKKRFSHWHTGRHSTESYLKYKRETALRTFLYLGIPAEYLDIFFRWYGMAFGYSTDGFVTTFSGKENYIMTESYIRDLICIGLAYDVINYIIPVRASEKAE